MNARCLRNILVQNNLSFNLIGFENPVLSSDKISKHLRWSISSVMRNEINWNFIRFVDYQTGKNYIRAYILWHINTSDYLAVVKNWLKSNKSCFLWKFIGAIICLIYNQWFVEALAPLQQQFTRIFMFVWMYIDSFNCCYTKMHNSCVRHGHDKCWLCCTAGTWISWQWWILIYSSWSGRK